MKTYPTERIRNVALVGASSAGKTMLAEAMLFRAGALDRMGSIEAENTVCDYEPEERDAGSSQVMALASFEWNDHKINLLDTPGSFDFAGEQWAAMAVADLLVMVVDATAGVDHAVANAWRRASEAGIPRLFFINKLDREFVSFDGVLSELQETFDSGVAPLELPISEGPGFCGVADLLSDDAWLYEGTSITETAIPADMADRVEQVRESLIEGIVVADDDLLERYLEGEVPSAAELERTLGQGVAEASVFPVICGSATMPIGVDRLCNYICGIGPSPLAARPLRDTAGESVPLLGDASPVLLVFKTTVDPYLGTVSVFKVATGTLAADTNLQNSRTGNSERVRTLVTLCGATSEPATGLAAGDIGAVAKLADTTTGDTLGDGSIELAPPPCPEAMLSFAVVPRSKADEEKLSNALRRLCGEDPSLRVTRPLETRQTLLSGLGDMHLRTALKRIERKFNVGVDIEDLRIPFRETITTKAAAEGKHKKQTGGHGQFGIAHVRIEPLPRGSGFEFSDEITGGVIPRQYIPAVEAGIREAMANGGRHGYPVVDLRATVYDGKYHSVDSSEMSFKMAGRLAFNAALDEARPVVLEPVSAVDVRVPGECLGDVIGDLSSRRAIVQGTDPGNYGEQHIRALVPESELVRYAIDLRSITGGRGVFTASHDHYAVLPGAPS